MDKYSDSEHEPNAGDHTESSEVAEAPHEDENENDDEMEETLFQLNESLDNDVNEIQQKDTPSDVCIENGSISAPKKPKSAWMLYTMEQRSIFKEEHEREGKDKLTMGAAVQLMAERFRALSESEKAVYNEMAAKDKERYHTQMEQYKELIRANPELAAQSAGSLTGMADEPVGLIIPLARLRRTLKADPEVASISKDATFAIGKSTELFIQHLALRVCNDAKVSRNANSLRMSDLTSSISKSNQLRFLAADFPHRPEQSKPKANHTSSGMNDHHSNKKRRVTDPVAAGGSRLTSFFGAAESS